MLTSAEPKVSVIIPTYKRSDYLTRAVDSVFKQTYKNIEVVIVDDNPPDSPYRGQTEANMRLYCNDQRVIYVKNQFNMGGSLARNEGIRRSNGEYITFLDDDDVYLPDKVRTQIEFMVTNKYDMCFTDLRLYDTLDNLVDYREYHYIKDFCNECLLKHHIMRHITGTPTFMYKRECIEKIGGFPDAKMGQEFYLMLKTIEIDTKIGYLPQANVIAYLHKGEKISSGKNKISGEEILYSFKKRYFDRLTSREKMFVHFRHHVVMAIAGKRNKDMFLMIKHGALASCSSPIDAVLELLAFFKRILLNKKNIQK